MSLVHRARVFCGALALFCSFCLITAAQTPVSLPAVPPRELAAIETIEAALARPFSINAVNMPLRDIAANVAEKTGVHIRLAKNIENAGISVDQPVTASVHNISLESFLLMILSDLNLTVVIKNEVLTITTLEDAQSPENMATRVYPVADLVRMSDGRNDFDQLIDLITSTIEPDSWQDVGGPGSLHGFDNNLSLVSSQRRDIHQRIEALLGTLRNVKKWQRISTPIGTTATTSDSPLSRSLKYSRGSNALVPFHSAAQAPWRQIGGGGMFSVRDQVAKTTVGKSSQQAARVWNVPQVYEAAK